MKQTTFWLSAIVCIFIVAALAFGLLGTYDNTGQLPWYLKASLLVQMSFVIALAALLWRNIPENMPAENRKAAWALVLGLLLSFGGDFVNSRLVDLTFIMPVQTMLSVPFFAAAHVFYILAFYRLGRPYLQAKPKALPVSIVLLVIASLVFWLTLINPEAPPDVRYPALFYAFLVTGMGIAGVWVALAHGARGVGTMVGGLLFVLSDAMLGYYLPDMPPLKLGLIIWAIYVAGQLLIARTVWLAYPAD